MGITVSRKTGKIVTAPELTEQQKQDMAMAVFRAFCQLHPDVIHGAVENYQKEAG